nr:PREDICTED: plectin-like [Latimeria chalumnae]|eukprot:XP_006013495.2 PREDICTED: plectin-like [Latimeria chalumnae]
MEPNHSNGISQAFFQGLRKPVPQEQLFEAGIISEKTLKDLESGTVSVEELSQKEEIKQYLSGRCSLAGFWNEANDEKMSIYQAMLKKRISLGAALILLEAQAATGYILDPIQNRELSVEEAIKEGTVGAELQEKLLTAEKAVTGYLDPQTGDTISLFQAMKKGFIYREDRIRLLEAQVATGGIIDPIRSHRLPVEVACKRGYFNKEMNTVFSDPSYLRNGFFDPNTNQNLTYEQLLKKCKVDSNTGLYLLPLKITFKALRRTVTATELLEANILQKEQYEDLKKGTTTVQEITQMRSVKKYLEGTGSIAGVYVQSSKRKLSIYEAMRKRILRPGTTMILLEAQAATGFLIDPINNKNYTVTEAVNVNLVGMEFKTKLLSAERAVTGYTDPHTGHKISLFQAMKKDYIVKEHAIRLLEAQIATGGIIDPVHSHRLPVQVAYERGYFDEEMNQVLADPRDDTKGFFDPNTHENLTYLQLLQRCMKDPTTGHCLLQIAEKGSDYYSFYGQIQNELINKTLNVTVGKFKGQTLSIWDLLYTEYITEEKRQELLQQYKKRTITIEVMAEIIITIIQQKEITERLVFRGLRKQVSAAQLLDSKIINEKIMKQLSQGTITKETLIEMDSVKQYLEGTSCIAGVFVQSTKETMSIYQAMRKGVLRPGTALVLLEAQAATGFIIEPTQNQKLSCSQHNNRGENR